MGLGGFFSTFNKNLWLVSSADVVILTHIGTQQETPVSTSTELQVEHISWHYVLLYVNYQYRNPYFK